MNQANFLSIIFLLLCCFIKNKEVLAIRTKRRIKVSPTNIASMKPEDPRLLPEKYCDSKCIPTVQNVSASLVDYIKDAEGLFDSFKGIGTKEKKIIETLTRRGMIQRIQIAAAYRDVMRKKFKAPFDLKDDLNMEIGGAFRLAIMAVLTPIPVLYAEEINKSIAPASIEPEAVVEMLCTISNFGVKAVAEFYEIIYSSPLEKAVSEDTEGAFQKVLVATIQGKQTEGQEVDNGKATADAKTLNGPGSKPWKGDKSPFNDIFSHNSYAHLRQVFVEYRKVAGREIEEDIKTEFAGATGQGLVAFVKCVKSKVKFFAERLDEIIRTQKEAPFDRAIIRIVVSRSEIDLGDINTEYQKIYNKTLYSSIKDKIGGDYRRTLTNIILGNIPSPTANLPGK